MKIYLLFLLLFPAFYFLGNGDGIFFQKEDINNAPSLISLDDSSKVRENPVIPGDFADPSVIRVSNIYYAAGTSSEWAPHFPIFQSTDLLHWKQTGYAFSKTPSWTSASFWAPELFYHNGLYYLYYVARKKSDGISCIGVATSKDPAEGFTDHGILLEFGKEAIDPFIIEDNGKLYITWKAYGLDQRPIELLGSRLSDDGLKVEGEPFMLLRDDEKKGLEGQCLVKRNGYYYLFYSVGACCGSRCSYEVEIARSASLKGPYTKFTNNPILLQTQDWKCMGHGTIVTSKEGNDYYLYHAYNKTDDVYTGRQGMLGKVTWNAQTGWPSIQPQGRMVEIKKNFRDDFLGDTLSYAWQWDFRNCKPHWKIEKGNLYLSGQTSENNITGSVLAVRPITGNYEMTTEVVSHNSSLKGLVLYGDAAQAIGIGVQNNKIEVWEVRKQKRTILKEEAVAYSKSLYLKMKVEKGYQCRFYWSDDGKKWKEVKTGGDYYNGDFLPPWDRSPRPSLLQKGSATAPAVFSFFDITYQ